MIDNINIFERYDFNKLILIYLYDFLILIMKFLEKKYKHLKKKYWIILA